MFQIKDTVLYGAEGVFVIDAVTEMDFQDEKKSYFVLKSLNNEKSTIYVPQDKTGLLEKMRRILSKEEIYYLIKNMPEEEPIWIEDESVRMVEYKGILLKGDHREMIGMIRTLYLKKMQLKEIGKNLHKVDEKFLKDAEKILYDEFAYVLDIKPEQVLPFIQQQIEL